jgi:hypothetical protein
VILDIQWLKNHVDTAEDVADFFGQVRHCLAMKVIFYSRFR